MRHRDDPTPACPRPDVRGPKAAPRGGLRELTAMAFALRRLRGGEFVTVGGAHPHAGAWLELTGACGLLAGSFGSLRQEGIRDGPQHIPVVDLGEPDRGVARA